LGIGDLARRFAARRSQVDFRLNGGMLPEATRQKHFGGYAGGYQQSQRSQRRWRRGVNVIGRGHVLAPHSCVEGGYDYELAVDALGSWRPAVIDFAGRRLTGGPEIAVGGS